jgi:hypothetical protein
MFVTDGVSGPIVFDTDQQLFHLLTATPVSGSITRDAIDWPGGSANVVGIRNHTQNMATITSVATHLVGLVRFTYSSGANLGDPALPTGAWCVAGGSHLLICKAFQASNGSWPTNVSMSSLGVATFYKSGDQIVFKEQIRLFDNREELLGTSLRGYTADFRLFPAAFS